MTARFRTLSQAPQAVRSAGGRRRDWALPAGAPAGGAFQADKCDAVGLTVQVHRLRNISTAAAVRAVVRSHSSPPSLLRNCQRREREIRRRVFCVTNHEQELAGCRTRRSFTNAQRVATGQNSRSPLSTWVDCSSRRRCRSAPAHLLPENTWPRNGGESHKALISNNFRSPQRAKN